MSNGTWAPGGPELENLAVEWYPSPALDIIRPAPAPAPLRPSSPPTFSFRPDLPSPPPSSLFIASYPSLHSPPISPARRDSLSPSPSPSLYYISDPPSGPPSSPSTPYYYESGPSYRVPRSPSPDVTLNTPVSIRKTPRRKERKRFALPIIIDGETESVTIMACPDTGSAESIISLELAKQLGLQVSAVDESFSLANGKVVKSLGVATVRYSFGAPGVVKTGGPEESLEFTVHVFETLAVPAIIGSSFLDETETFTKHRDRLVEESVTALQSLRVCSVGKPRKGLVCRLDSFVGCANADTGSDLDLVSPKFVHQRGLKIRDDVEMILEFADGSTGWTRGSIDVHFAIGNVDNERGFVPRGNALDLEFFILDDLTSDILVGQDTLVEMNVISENGDLVINSVPQPGLSDCNIIRHIGSVERAARSALKTAKEMIFNRKDKNSRMFESPSLLAIIPLTAWSLVLASLVVETGGPKDDLTAMQRENARLEAEGIGAVYECKFSGCTAAPFQTQYLLNSHANIHSSARPHYCPVAGCPRGEGGKGFKRKNEMIRHTLVHDSPGYICPFCPDREHKYPRPDQLQRYVSLKSRILVGITYQKLTLWLTRVLEQTC